MIGRPPISTLFPYPPLSRSDRHVRERCRARAASFSVPLLPHRIDHLAAAVAERRLERPVALEPPVQRRVVRIGLADRRRDRKSTRLNSSHSQISYAVFCLKK